VLRAYKVLLDILAHKGFKASKVLKGLKARRVHKAFRVQLDLLVHRDFKGYRARKASKV
jgi:hypothetical protein